MGTTTHYQFPYPEASDPPAGHTQIKALADAVDAKLPLVQGGRVVATFNNQAAVSVQITFATAYSSPPTVVATGENRYRNVSVDNVTTTGCSIVMQSDNNDTKVTGPVDVNWIAFGAR